jgi:DHA2 family methylenomycin A resistance protein-like MFS transporter
MTVGLALGAIGSLCLLLVGPDSGYAAVLPLELGLGIGMGSLTAAVVHAAIAALPPDRAGLASGVNNTSRQALGALGVTTYGAVVSHTGIIHGLHTLGYLGAALWLASIALTWLTT